MLSNLIIIDSYYWFLLLLILVHIWFVDWLGLGLSSGFWGTVTAVVAATGTLLRVSTGAAQNNYSGRSRHRDRPNPSPLARNHSRKEGAGDGSCIPIDVYYYYYCYYLVCIIVIGYYPYRFLLLYVLNIILVDHYYNISIIDSYRDRFLLLSWVLLRL